MAQYTLLIDTQDKKGIIYEISKIIYENDLNIYENSEFVDKENDKFFMRTVFDGELVITNILAKFKKILHKNSFVKLRENKKKDIVILATKEEHVLGDLLLRHYAMELNVNIKAVISNHKSLEELVKKFDIPFYYISTKNLRREEHERKIAQKIDIYNPDIIVLAKYMRILTPDFVGAYARRILNIHHSFLPAFIGANPYKQAFDRGVKSIGATAHFVTNDLDEGQIIAQGIAGVNHKYSWQDMQKTGRDIEKAILAKALDLLLKDKVFIYGNKTVIL